MGKRLILQADGAEWDGFDNRQKQLLGKTGVARTPLHPGGIAIIDQKRIDVVSRGEMIAPETQIKVIEVSGNRIVVSAI